MSEKGNAQLALHYHQYPQPGKISIQATKPLANQLDLSLAYSPGVAAACAAIVENPLTAFNYTSKGNLVAVITNGTAVLGLGNIGPVAAKPVMEGKAVLFKKFANIDSIDLEINQTDADALIDIISALEPSFGAINLEDIKAPECFYIETKLKERMNVPVFHDDQHGTAIVTAAALLNAFEITTRNIADAKIVCIGAGAAALSCLDLFVQLGACAEHIELFDADGYIYAERQSWDTHDRRCQYARTGSAISIEEALKNADVLLGLSTGNVVRPSWLKKMRDKPIVFPLANPIPEILPEAILSVRSDALIATGRSDYPNQVNNVLCFPFIFRGALDAGAVEINQQMQLACVKAIAQLAKKEMPAELKNAYTNTQQTFGAEYLIPKAFDVRLITEIAPAVAKAAMDSGVATRPIEDFNEYIYQLKGFAYRTSAFMRPVLSLVNNLPSYRLAYAEGEDERVLHAVQLLVDERIVYPVLIGRKAIIALRIKKLGLRLKEGRDYEVCNTDSDERYREYWNLYHQLQGRGGVDVAKARMLVRTDTTVIASLMLKRNEVDGAFCGTNGDFKRHYQHACDIIGTHSENTVLASVSILVLEKSFICLADTHAFNPETPNDVATLAAMTSALLQSFGITPKIAFISDADFGSNQQANAHKMRQAAALFAKQHPDIEADGEMRVDTALNTDRRFRLLKHSRLQNNANSLIFPNKEIARIVFSAIHSLQQCYSIGPIMMGAARPIHILNSAASVRNIYNTSIFAALGIDKQRES